MPKSRGRDTITEPFFYDVQGKQVLESSLAVVMKDASGKMLGVSAVDLALDDLQKQFGAIRLYETGYVRMVSEGGLFVVNPQAELVGKAVASGDPLAANLDKIKKGAPGSGAVAPPPDKMIKVQVAADGRALARALRVAGKVDPLFVDSVDGLAEAALAQARAGDVVIVMGAGSIGTVAQKLKDLLEGKQ